MRPDVCWLITVLDGDTLLRCAVRFSPARLSRECLEYYMEPEHRKHIREELLPMHVRDCGPIVQIEEIFDIEDKTAR